MSGNSIADGFMTLYQVRLDQLGLLTQAEICACARKASSGEVEGAQAKIKLDAEITAAKRAVQKRSGTESR